LQAAAPDVWAEMSRKGAADQDIREGDVVNVSTPRGTIRAQVRISGIRDAVLFVPFHYGYWDIPTASKWPIFKTAAARVQRISAGDGNPAPVPTNTASRPLIADVPVARGGPAANAEEWYRSAR
jgi:anaerobic selenocysteine-containing dehydrogenase